MQGIGGNLLFAAGERIAANCCFHCSPNMVRVAIVFVCYS